MPPSRIFTTADDMGRAMLRHTRRAPTFGQHWFERALPRVRQGGQAVVHGHPPEGAGAVKVEQRRSVTSREELDGAPVHAQRLLLAGHAVLLQVVCARPSLPPRRVRPWGKHMTQTT